MHSEPVLPGEGIRMEAKWMVLPLKEESDAVLTPKKLREER